LNRSWRTQSCCWCWYSFRYFRACNLWWNDHVKSFTACKRIWARLV